MSLEGYAPAPYNAFVIVYFQLPEWEVTQRTPSDALLREASPPTALTHWRPAEGDFENSPPCWDYKRPQPSAPHHLITLRPTPSHWVVRLQSGFPRDAYIGLVRENMSYDVKIPSEDFDDDISPTNSTRDRPGQGHLRRVKTPSPATNHQDLTTIGAFRPFILPWAGINILLLWIGRTTTTDDSSANSVPFPAPKTTREDHEGEAHATGHIMGFG